VATIPSTTTTTIRGTLPDVGIVEIKGAPKRIDAGKVRKVEVIVKNYGNSTQTRNVSLFLNGTPVGPGVSVTLAKGKEQGVKFDVQFNTPGTDALKASLFPGDSNPDNDTKTMTVIVQDKGKSGTKTSSKNASNYSEI
jgi:hypothetical protein